MFSQAQNHQRKGINHAFGQDHPIRINLECLVVEQAPVGPFQIKMFHLGTVINFPAIETGGFSIGRIERKDDAVPEGFKVLFRKEARLFQLLKLGL